VVAVVAEGEVKVALVVPGVESLAGKAGSSLSTSASRFVDSPSSVLGLELEQPVALPEYFAGFVHLPGVS
jgi:hypothetical protein